MFAFKDTSYEVQCAKISTTHGSTVKFPLEICPARLPRWGDPQPRLAEVVEIFYSANLFDEFERGFRLCGIIPEHII